MAGSADDKRWAILPPPSAETAAWSGPLLPGRSDRPPGKRAAQRGDSGPAAQPKGAAEASPTAAAERATTESAIIELEPTSSTQRTQRQQVAPEGEAGRSARRRLSESYPASAPSSLPAAGDVLHESTGIRRALDARIAEARARSIEARKRQAQENVETIPAPPPGDEIDD